MMSSFFLGNQRLLFLGLKAIMFLTSRHRASRRVIFSHSAFFSACVAEEVEGSVHHHGGHDDLKLASIIFGGW